ncbi:hypothetical protein B0181_10825 [Moraxella caviae]|uniref:Cytochrome c n=1 Tax=Moraxella caviae TaxID=34060 RepID=A0A1S9ZV00_9GAMM|nr:cytochrome c [Moraxella caviae]OOR87207.1 hypothetical protein B0181_10825 [Moraxella caviae]STZ09932.1 Cytochrome c' [Moraxella caviae]
MKKFTLVAAIATALTLTACSSTSNEPAAVKARQDAMQDWRGANDILKGMVENPANFDAAAFKEQAEFIASGTEAMWAHFANEADKGGDSLDNVWTDAAGFKAKADAFDAAANELVAAAANATQTSDIEAAYGKMGESCGACHKEFKK